MAYITSTDLSARLSATKLARIYDDDRDGTADTDPVALLIADACSKVAGYLRGLYDLAVIEAAPPHEVVRLTLDVAVAMAAQRHPEVVRVDWVPLMQGAERDLERLRAGKTRLDVMGSPEPAANASGGFSEGDPSQFDGATALPVFSGEGFGDF